MKVRILFLISMAFAGVINLNAQCSIPIHISKKAGVDLPSYEVPNSCLGSGFTITWKQHKNSTPQKWSVDFGNSSPCLDPSTKKAKYTFSNSNPNDDSCLILSTNATPTCVDGDPDKGAACFKYKVVADGNPNDPQVIVDRSRHDGHKR